MIRTRFGTHVTVISAEDDERGTTWVKVRTERDEEEEYALDDLRADDGLNEIMAAIRQSTGMNTERGSVDKRPAHAWKWIGHYEAYYFGDRNKPYARDEWKCARCGKYITSAGSSGGPADGTCARMNTERLPC